MARGWRASTGAAAPRRARRRIRQGCLAHGLISSQPRSCRGSVCRAGARRLLRGGVRPTQGLGGHGRGLHGWLPRRQRHPKRQRGLPQQHPHLPVAITGAAFVGLRCDPQLRSTSNLHVHALTCKVCQVIKAVVNEAIQTVTRLGAHRHMRAAALPHEQRAQGRPAAAAVVGPPRARDLLHGLRSAACCLSLRRRCCAWRARHIWPCTGRSVLLSAGFRACAPRQRLPHKGVCACCAASRALRSKAHTAVLTAFTGKSYIPVVYQW